ncbi:MAG: hypothetical protein PVJ66_08160 [Gammaproteobacteria bacterium]|jgi:hypothetical protein
MRIRIPEILAAGFLALLAMSLLAGCETLLASKYDINSQFYKIPAGSKLILHQPLNIPAGKAHVVIVPGNSAADTNVDAVNCKFEVRNLGPARVQPDTFDITRAEMSREWVSQPSIMRFYRVLHLQSARQPDVLKLMCEDWDGPMLGKNISIPEMRAALGDVITLEFPSR